MTSIYNKYQSNSVNFIVKKFRKSTYIHDFRIEGDELICNKTRERFKSEDLMVGDILIFEIDANNASVIYGITSYSGTNGIILDNYGSNANSSTHDFIKKVQWR